MFAPNSKLSNAKIINYSREPSRILELKFNVPRNADLAQLRRTVLDGLGSEHVEASPPPQILVDALGDTTVTLAVRIAVASHNWNEARPAIQERLKSLLDTAPGIAQAVH